MKINKWDQIYKLPLKLDDYNTYAWSKNGTMSLMFDGRIKKEDKEKIIKCINGEINFKISNLNEKDTEFFDGDDYIFCVRGWSYLTRTLNFKVNKAAKIQDDFCKYILNKLK